MRTVALEEHFVTKSFLRATGAAHAAHPAMARLHPKLLDLGDGRITAMDESAIDVQVLSLASMGIDSLDSPTATSLIHEVNDELGAAIREHPSRFAGLAALNLKDLAAAADELERCITQHRFVGVLLDGTIDGLFLDDPRFLPVFEAAAHLGVPVYLHPALPPPAIRHAYYSGLPGDLGFALSIAGWGWHAETALHTLRLIVCGLFDRLPNLQLIIGHMGEGLPYALARSSAVLSNAAPNLHQPVAGYFKSNIHITTSGYFTLPPLRCAVDVVGIDRLMFSVDYPFSPNTNGRGLLDAVSTKLTPADFAALSHGNADRLLRLHSSD
jgi:predicted TIM-barrel fold metal-dependent hydrolase